MSSRDRDQRRQELEEQWAQDAQPVLDAATAAHQRERNGEPHPD